MKPMTLLKSTFYLTRLLTQLSVLFVTYRNRRRRAKKLFKQQLVKSGLSTIEADELARAFPSLPSIIELMRLSRPESL
jgi:hypothetical protein